MADDTSAAPVPVKPGWQTTEFWLNLLTAVVGAVLASGLPSSNKAMQIAGVGAMVLATLGHTVSRTMVKNAAQVLLIGVLALGSMGMTGCKAIDAKMAKTFQDRDAVLMQQLGAYLDQDAKAGKKTADQVAAEKAGIAAHLLTVTQDITKVLPDEESKLMAELLAYVQADPNRDADSKQYKSDSVQAHLRLFQDLQK